jgi:hypothetical protein
MCKITKGKKKDWGMAQVADSLFRSTRPIVQIPVLPKKKKKKTNIYCILYHPPSPLEKQ